MMITARHQGAALPRARLPHATAQREPNVRKEVSQIKVQ